MNDENEVTEDIEMLYSRQEVEDLENLNKPDIALYKIGEGVWLKFSGETYSKDEQKKIVRETKKVYEEIKNESE